MNDTNKRIVVVLPVLPLPDVGDCTLLVVLDDQSPEYVDAPVSLGVRHLESELRGLTVGEATRRIECWTDLLDLGQDRIVETSQELEGEGQDETFKVSATLSRGTTHELGTGLPIATVALFAPPGFLVGLTLDQATELVTALAGGEFSADNPPPPPPCAACGDVHEPAGARRR